MEKYQAFLINAKELSDEYSFIPLLYGSLGLEVLTGDDLSSDDIDILIPEIYIKGNRWEKFRDYLESLGYKLVDLHEHTFVKNNIYFSYATIENLEEFAGIGEGEIEIRADLDIKYMLLNLSQYLRVYEASSKDGYRQDKKEYADLEKIDFIKSKMKNR